MIKLDHSSWGGGAEVKHSLPRPRICFFHSRSFSSERVIFKSLTVPRRHCTVFCFSFHLPGSGSEKMLKLSGCTVWQKTATEPSADLSPVCVRELQYLIKQLWHLDDSDVSVNTWIGSQEASRLRSNCAYIALIECFFYFIFCTRDYKKNTLLKYKRCVRWGQEVIRLMQGTSPLIKEKNYNKDNQDNFKK